MEKSLYFYYRDGCHLCEAMASEIHRGWPSVMQQMEWRLVDKQEQWKAEYGLKIPLLALEDKVLCYYELDTDVMREYFGNNANPV